eukprot:1123792-Prymnesium_polylepis.1
MGIVAALPLIPLVGLLIDYIGPLPVMYLSAYCVFAEYAVLAYFPPSQMLLEAYWLTASAPIVSMSEPAREGLRAHCIHERVSLHGIIRKTQPRACPLMCRRTDMSWLVFLRSKLLPDPLKMNRDLG